HIEPYASQAALSRKGSKILSDGTDVNRKGNSDCVQAVRTPLIEKNPQAIRTVIKALMVAQHQAETNPEAALKDTVGTYYKTTMEAARTAMQRQPIVVDQRNQAQFILDRGQSMKDMGYIKRMPDDKAMDWSLLESVIAENASLYESLKFKSA